MDVPFKEGDIITLDNGDWIIIFAGLKEENKAIKYYAVSARNYSYVRIAPTIDVGVGYCTKDRDMKYATMDEIHTFFTNIEKKGFRWNAKEKKLERFKYVESNV